MVHTVRNALASVKNGESDLYDDLVRAMQVNKRYDYVALAAQLEVNVVEGLKLYEEMVDSKEVSQLVSLVNNLRMLEEEVNFRV